MTAELGPFRPPSAFEPEFLPPVPRPIPEELRSGREAKQRATILYSGAFLAAACLLAWRFGGWIDLEHYFVPARYLPWVAAGALPLAALALLSRRLVADKYAYVREGIPMPARILGIQLVVAGTHNGSAIAYRYDCLVEYLAPESSQPAQRLVSSPQFSVMFKDSTATPLRVGDYVTAVALPNKPDKSFTLYGFLQLSPRADFIQRKGKELSQLKPALEAAKYAGLFVALLSLVLAVTVVPALVPWSLPERVDPLIAGSAAGMVFVAGWAGGVIWARRHDRSERARNDAKNEQARREGRAVEPFVPFATGLTRLLLGPCFGLAAVLLLTLAVSALNAMLDRSPASFEIVRLEGYLETTYALIFRNYEIRYHGAGDEIETLSVPVRQLAWFEAVGAELGALERHAGRWGMPWIRNIHPVIGAGGEQGFELVFPDGSRAKLAPR
jgi:hypothetical protein